MTRQSFRATASFGIVAVLTGTILIGCTTRRPPRPTPTTTATTAPGHEHGDIGGGIDHHGSPATPRSTVVRPATSTTAAAPTTTAAPGHGHGDHDH